MATGQRGKDIVPKSKRNVIKLGSSNFGIHTVKAVGKRRVPHFFSWLLSLSFQQRGFCPSSLSSTMAEASRDLAQGIIEVSSRRLTTFIAPCLFIRCMQVMVSESVCAKERMEAREAGMCHVVFVAAAPNFHSV